MLVVHELGPALLQFHDGDVSRRADGKSANPPNAGMALAAFAVAQAMTRSSGIPSTTNFDSTAASSHASCVWIKFAGQVALYEAVCRLDCEGIVAKWAHGQYHTDGRVTSWLKIKNPAYSQTEGRREQFEVRHPRVGRRTRTVALLLGPELTEVRSTTT